MRNRDYILRFLMILLIAIGCSAAPPQQESESNNSPEFVDRTPSSKADQIPTNEPEQPEEVKLERPSDPVEEEEQEEELEQEAELILDDEPEEEEEQEEEVIEEEEDEQGEEEYVNTVPINLDVLCFSYLDCPNHEACNIISSTCYHCTESWQCNNRYDLKRASRPSFCCTEEAYDEGRCDLIGTCKE